MSLRSVLLTMPSRLCAVFLFLLAVPVLADEQPKNGPDRSDRERVAAGRMYVLQPQHVLSDAERADFAARGLVVLRPMAEGRYLVRRSPDSTVDANDGRVR